MLNENQQLTCPKYSKYCSMQRLNKRSFLPQPSNDKIWTRNAPMGGILNPRIIPPMKSTSDQCNQTNILLKESVIVPKRPVIPRDYEVNPRMKTMYQYQFGDSGDAILGYCDNRSILERNRYFKNSQRVQNDLLQVIRNGGKGSVRRYKSNYSKRISEYMAETSFIGGKILKSRIHDHSKCGASASRCVHNIDF